MTNEEPTVLDYVKSLLTPWKGAPLAIPPLPSDLQTAEEQPVSLVGEEEALTAQDQLDVVAEPAGEAVSAAGEESQALEAYLQPFSPPPAAVAAPLSAPAEPFFARRAGEMAGLPWRSLVAFVLALTAQLLLEPTINRSVGIAVGLYVLAAVLLIWAILRQELTLSALGAEAEQPMTTVVRRLPFIIALPFVFIAFLAFGNNRFTSFNIVIWLLTIFYWLVAMWQTTPETRLRWKARKAALLSGNWQIRFSTFGLLLLAVIGLAVFFRVYRLAQVPSEMFSDHAEKLLDVGDVLNGQTSIFFPRNTGREALQMYLTAAIAVLCGTGLSFMSLKLGTVLAGLLTLPYMYLLGKEVGNRWVGLLALFFAGIAYWPNVISRVGLRFPLYPLFVAPTLFYLLRGLRTSSRNDIILAGLALGIGLHGYSPIRILPFVVVVAFSLYLLHAQSRGKRKEAVVALVLLALTALVIFLPLGRYALQNPEMFGYRAFSRLGTTERPLPGSIPQIFMSNLGRAMGMYFYNDGEIWVHSVPYRPALDVVSAALFLLGLVALLVRYIRQRHWVDLFMILAVPLLMLPSILSLAFPAENPALNRTGGAMVPVFIIIALAAEGLLSALRASSPRWGGLAAAVLMLGMVWFPVQQNYTLVFDQYASDFDRSSWNTDEMGRVIRGFVDSIGAEDTAYVIPYPYWVDTRLVGINAGFPQRDYALSRDQIADTVSQTGAKLFIVNQKDIETLTTLQTVYPDGSEHLHEAEISGKGFFIYLVPPRPGSW